MTGTVTEMVIATAVAVIDALDLERTSIAVATDPAHPQSQKTGTAATATRTVRDGIDPAAPQAAVARWDHAVAAHPLSRFLLVVTA